MCIDDFPEWLSVLELLIKFITQLAEIILENGLLDYFGVQILLNYRVNILIISISVGMRIIHFFLSNFPFALKPINQLQPCQNRARLMLCRTIHCNFYR